MKFKKGESGNKNGRPKGATNITNRLVKEVVASVFNELQDDPKHCLLAFAKKYPRDFYAIAAKLIPTEITGNVKQTITVTIVD